MNYFDLSILTFLNSFVDSFPHIDVFIVYQQHNNLAKGGLLMAVWWYCWFQGVPERTRILHRGKLLAGLLAMMVGIAIARLLAHVLPFRVRPFENPQLHFTIPDLAAGLGNPAGWSAFPSDHAVAWFSIAATIYLANRRAGWLILAYALLLGLGRIYVGYHHPSDILGGAAIGVLSVLAFNSRLVGRYVVFPILQWEKSRPGWFYAGLFLCTYEISNLFDEVRVIAVLAWSVVKHLV